MQQKAQDKSRTTVWSSLNCAIAAQITKLNKNKISVTIFFNIKKVNAHFGILFNLLWQVLDLYSFVITYAAPPQTALLRLLDND